MSEILVAALEASADLHGAAVLRELRRLRPDVRAFGAGGPRMRAEGFGLPLAEAMYLGKPTIATGYSGNLEFMNAENSHLVRYTMTEVGEAGKQYPPNGVWADPDVEHAAELMRRVFEDQPGSRALGERAAADIRRTNSMEAAGASMELRLANLVQVLELGPRRSSSSRPEPDSAAQRLHLPVAQAPKLIQGDRLTLGRYVIPDVSVWAFEARSGETSPLIEGERANYVFRLDSLYAAGTPPLAQVRDRVLAAARSEKKHAIARQRATEALAVLASAPDLLQGGRARGLPVDRLGPFTRLNPPSAIAREPAVEGAAFGLRPGQRTGVLVGTTGGGCFILQGIARQAADSAAWLKQRDQQRETIVRAAQQARVQQYLAALRAQAQVVDRRKEVFRPTTSEGGV